jgi:hypothetical protein
MGLQGANHSDTHWYRADWQRRKRVFQTASATRYLQVRGVYHMILIRFAPCNPILQTTHQLRIFRYKRYIPDKMNLSALICTMGNAVVGLEHVPDQHEGTKMDSAPGSCFLMARL